MALAGKILLFLAYLMLYCHQSASILSSDFYPFGQGEGDTLLLPGLDVSSPAISISPPFLYYGSTYSNIFVSSNGILSFTTGFTSPTVVAFPLSSVTPIIAPYWADVDRANGGEIFYRAITNDPVLLQRASDTIQLIPTQAGFSATWMFVATWDEVAFYEADSVGILRRNTFQCVLVTDEVSSFAIFNYKRIEWTTSVFGGGDSSTGLGGSPALVGFNAGDGLNAFEIPESRTDDILSITNLTNVGIDGLFIFQINEGQIVGEIDINECLCEPCNFGDCSDLENGFICTCDPGYTGVLCDIDIGECASNPCAFGNCTDMVNDFSCICDPGYTGAVCDIDINECASYPCKFGTCNDMVNGFTCTCFPGFTGELCDDDINECESSSCVSGVCKDAVNGYYCKCDKGYTGKNCDIDINQCRSSPCKQGDCINLPNGYECICPWHYPSSECDIYFILLLAGTLINSTLSNTPPLNKRFVYPGENSKRLKVYSERVTFLEATTLCQYHLGWSINGVWKEALQYVKTAVTRHSRTDLLDGLWMGILRHGNAANWIRLNCRKVGALNRNPSLVSNTSVEASQCIYLNTTTSAQLDNNHYYAGSCNERKPYFCAMQDSTLEDNFIVLNETQVENETPVITFPNTSYDACAEKLKDSIFEEYGAEYRKSNFTVGDCFLYKDKAYNLPREIYLTDGVVDSTTILNGQNEVIFDDASYLNYVTVPSQLPCIPTTKSALTTLSIVTEQSSYSTASTSEDIIHVTPSTDSNGQCNCQCSESFHNNITSKEVQKRIEKLKEALTIDKKSVKNFQMTKQSASDDRTSSAAIGYVGAFFLFSVVFVIIALDFPYEKFNKRKLKKTNKDQS